MFRVQVEVYEAQEDCLRLKITEKSLISSMGGTQLGKDRSLYAPGLSWYGKLLVLMIHKIILNEERKEDHRLNDS